MSEAERRRQQAEKQLRLTYAELCYFYPQYKLEDLTREDDNLPLGDMQLLINFARKQYYQDKLDMLQVMAGAQGKKGYKKVSEKYTNAIKKLEAQI